MADHEKAAFEKRVRVHLSKMPPDIRHVLNNRQSFTEDQYIKAQRRLFGVTTKLTMVEALQEYKNLPANMQEIVDCKRNTLTPEETQAVITFTDNNEPEKTQPCTVCVGSRGRRYLQIPNASSKKNKRVYIT